MTTGSDNKNQRGNIPARARVCDLDVQTARIRGVLSTPNPAARLCNARVLVCDGEAKLVVVGAAPRPHTAATATEMRVLCELKSTSWMPT